MLAFVVLMRLSVQWGGAGILLWTVLLAVALGGEIWYFRKRDAENAGR